MKAIERTNPHMNNRQKSRQRSHIEEMIGDVLTEIRALRKELEGQAAIAPLSETPTQGTTHMSNAFNALKDEVRKQTTEIAGLRAVLAGIDRTPNDEKYNELMAELKANTDEVVALIKENTPAAVEPPVEPST